MGQKGQEIGGRLVKKNSKINSKKKKTELRSGKIILAEKEERAPERSHPRQRNPTLTPAITTLSHHHTFHHHHHLFLLLTPTKSVKMENDKGEIVDLYVPRKCSATGRIIKAKDHSSVQISIAKVRPDDEGVRMRCLGCCEEAWKKRGRQRETTKQQWTNETGRTHNEVGQQTTKRQTTDGRRRRDDGKNDGSSSKRSRVPDRMKPIFCCSTAQRNAHHLPTRCAQRQTTSHAESRRGTTGLKG